MAIKAIQCPCCGAALSFNPSCGLRVACAYCGSILDVHDEVGPEYYVGILKKLKTAVGGIDKARANLAKKSRDYVLRENEYRKLDRRVEHKGYILRIILTAICAFVAIVGAYYLFDYLDSLDSRRSFFSDLLSVFGLQHANTTVDYSQYFAWTVLAIITIGIIDSIIHVVRFKVHVVKERDSAKKLYETAESLMNKAKSKVDEYESILATYDEYLKMLPQTDSSTFDFLIRTLSAGKAQDIPEALLLNDERLNLAEKRAIEREKIALERENLAIERQKIRMAKKQQQQPQQVKVVHVKEETGVPIGKLLLGGAVIAGAAIVLGPVAGAVAAKATKHLIMK